MGNLICLGEKVIFVKLFPADPDSYRERRIRRKSAEIHMGLFYKLNNLD